MTPLEAARKGTVTPEMRRVSERENAIPEFIRDEVISTKDSLESHSREQLPNSQRVYVAGKLYPDVRVPMREVELAPTSFNDAIKPNEPVRLYDCSGPWGDPNFTGNSEAGLPALRAQWIRARGDVADYEGREVKSLDNGYLSGKLAEYASQAEKNRLVEFPGLQGQRRRPLRASQGHPVTQLWYARQGRITPEMEFIAIRENMKIADCRLAIGDWRFKPRQQAQRPRQAARRQFPNRQSKIGNRKSLHPLRLPPVPATYSRRDHP